MPDTDAPAGPDHPDRRQIRPRRRWYGVAVGLLVLGVAAGIGSLLLALPASRGAHVGSFRLAAGLAGAFACPVGAFLLAAVLGLVVALRRAAARRGDRAG